MQSSWTSRLLHGRGISSTDRYLVTDMLLLCEAEALGEDIRVKAVGGTDGVLLHAPERSGGDDSHGHAIMLPLLEVTIGLRVCRHPLRSVGRRRRETSRLQAQQHGLGRAEDAQRQAGGAEAAADDEVRAAGGVVALVETIAAHPHEHR